MENKGLGGKEKRTEGKRKEKGTHYYIKREKREKDKKICWKDDASVGQFFILQKETR